MQSGDGKDTCTASVKEAWSSWGGRGKLVVPHRHVNCSQCHYCLKDRPTMCSYCREYNFKPGGFSEDFIVPRWIVERGGIHMPLPGISPIQACLSRQPAS